MLRSTFLLAFALTISGVTANPNVQPQFLAQLENVPTKLARLDLFSNRDFIYDFNAQMTGEPGVTTGLDGESPMKPLASYSRPSRKKQQATPSEFQH